MLAGGKEILEPLIREGVDVTKMADAERRKLIKLAKQLHMVSLGTALTEANKLGDVSIHQGKKMRTFSCAPITLSQFSAQRHKDFKKLAQAVQKGQVDQVNEYLAQGPLDATTYNGDSLLGIASESGNLEMTALLLQHGALIDQVNTRGDTPLLIAVKSGHGRVAKYLIEHGANINAVDSDGKTPLLCAARKLGDDDHFVHVDFFLWLLEKTPDISIRDGFGNSLLHELADTQGINPTLRENLVKLVIEKAKNLIDAPNLKGQTPIMRAARSRVWEALSILEEAGADLTGKYKDGRTILHQLAGCDCLSHRVVNRAIKQGVGINEPDANGRTPLYWAAYCKHRGAVRKLLDEWGARPQTMDELLEIKPYISEKQWEQYSDALKKKQDSPSEVKMHAAMGKMKARAQGIKNERRRVSKDIHEVRTLDELNALHLEVEQKWLKRIERQRKISDAGYVKIAADKQQQAADSQRMIEVLCANIRRIRDLKGRGEETAESILVCNDNGHKTQGIALIKSNPDHIYISLLVTHPRNLDLAVSKHAVTGAGTALLSTIAKYALETNKGSVRLVWTDSAFDWYQQFGFKVEEDALVLQGEALKALASRD